MGFERMQALAGDLGVALAEAMKAHGWKLGRDVAVVISSDAVHYGDDFGYVPFGQGGVDGVRQGVRAGPLAADRPARRSGDDRQGASSSTRPA